MSAHKLSIFRDGVLLEARTITLYDKDKVDAWVDIGHLNPEWGADEDEAREIHDEIEAQLELGWTAGATTGSDGMYTWKLEVVPDPKPDDDAKNYRWGAE